MDEVGGRYLVTADHGNADDMVKHKKNTRDPVLDKEGKPVPLTSHTLWPVSTSHPGDTGVAQSCDVLLAMQACVSHVPLMALLSLSGALLH